MIPSALAFSPSSRQQQGKRLPLHQIITLSTSSNNNDIDDFDPFLQSPHAFGDNDDNENNSSSSSTTFGFLSYVEEERNDIEIQTSIDGDGEFDPLLSPHSYINGVDEPPVLADGDGTNISNRPFVSSSKSSSTFGFLSYLNNDGEESSNFAVSENTETSNSATEKYVDDEFDPLLSPHAYVDGVDEPPVHIDSTTFTQQAQKQQKIGILLIDHGSKRKASNEHIHNIASLYESRLVAKQNQGDASGTSTKIVRAAHMEIAPPSILDSLRSIIVNEKVSKVICVPYFLSPGKHATEDVPELIQDAKMILRKEGLLSINEEEVEGKDNCTCASILVSHALGTHMEGMLGAVDELVDWTLDG